MNSISNVQTLHVPNRSRFLSFVENFDRSNSPPQNEFSTKKEIAPRTSYYVPHTRKNWLESKFSSRRLFSQVKRCEKRGCLRRVTKESVQKMGSILNNSVAIVGYQIPVFGFLSWGGWPRSAANRRGSSTRLGGFTCPWKKGCERVRGVKRRESEKSVRQWSTKGEEKFVQAHADPMGIAKAVENRSQNSQDEVGFVSLQLYNSTFLPTIKTRVNREQVIEIRGCKRSVVSILSAKISSLGLPSANILESICITIHLRTHGYKCIKTYTRSEYHWKTGEKEIIKEAAVRRRKRGCKNLYTWKGSNLCDRQTTGKGVLLKQEENQKIRNRKRIPIRKRNGTFRTAFEGKNGTSRLYEFASRQIRKWMRLQSFLLTGFVSKYTYVNREISYDTHANHNRHI